MVRNVAQTLGLSPAADRPISPGDYIQLDSGHEGYVVHMGWRSTSMRTLGNNIIVLPNAVLARAVITNYARPQDRMSLDIRVGVPHGTDARRVERMLVEVAEEAARDRVKGLLAEFPPSAKLIPGFGPSTLDFTLSVQIRRFVDQYQVQSEFTQAHSRTLSEGRHRHAPAGTEAHPGQVAIRFRQWVPSRLPGCIGDGQPPALEHRLRRDW